MKNMLRDFLSDSKIAALQSDGFNVYMYLDNELIDVEHLCCLAHVRAKFKYALEQGKDEETEFFLRLIGVLYELEEEYRLRSLTPEQIRQERQEAKTAQIIQQLRQRLGNYAGKNRLREHVTDDHWY